jgi:hypothetical protein
MRQVYINQYEKVGSNDINSLQLAVHKSLFDDTLYPFLQKQNGVLAASFAPTYVSALAGSLAAGTGFFYDSTQTGLNPNYRMINAQSSIALAFAAANTSDRIDLVCLAPNFAVQSTASRYVKTGGTGPITLQTVNKIYQDTYTLDIVAGTPGVSPSAPALPSGYLAIAQAYIHANTGMASQADITDLRNQLSQASSSVGLVISGTTTINSQVNLLFCNTASAAFPEALPASASFPSRRITFVNTGIGSGNNVTIGVATGDYLHGTLNGTYALTPGDSITFASDGNGNWYQIHD